MFAASSARSGSQSADREGEEETRNDTQGTQGAPRQEGSARGPRRMQAVGALTQKAFTELGVR